MPPFDDPLAVPGINVNKKLDLDILSFLINIFSKTFCHSNEISFVLKRKYILEKAVSN